jgi:enoyl-CoA hydratase/carnithine racemase
MTEIEGSTMEYRTLAVSPVSERLWRIAFRNAPMNLVTPEFVAEISDVVFRMNENDELRVVIFESAIEHFFLNHFDLTQARAFPGGRDDPLWVKMILALTSSPVITIAAIRGRTRGGGNEFALACDLRYASREKAIFGQPEVATGIVPGGGATERLPRLIGRDRALQVILGSDDFDAKTAEHFGMVTATYDDVDLDAAVMRFSQRLAGFDKVALSQAKAMVNRASLPTESDLRSAYGEYFQSLSSPNFGGRMSKLAAKFGEIGPDLELRLGHHLGEIS